jgi:hypothetical protein
MAEETQNTSSGQPRTFDKGLNEDVNDFHLPANEWTQARNAINNSITGDLGKLGNEPANLKCVELDYPIIGTIHIIEDKWLLFSTDGNTNSEIGIFTESKCSYFKIVNASCLNFKLEKLIIGVSRPLSTCTYKAYWDDGINPSRTLEVDADNLARNLYTNPESTIPWIQNCSIINSCNICTNTSALDCDKLRLAQFINPICPRVQMGVSGGNLLNGSYFVVMAYAVNGQKISDWYLSNTQGLFQHSNSASSLDVYIDSVDLDYDEIIVGLGYVVNQQTVVRQAGIYSTRQTKLSFDTIFDTWPAIPIEQIPIMTPIPDKSDAMYTTGDYLIRVGPSNKQDFNYQPLANQIVSKWQSVNYPVDYYSKGNNNTGYMRDEVYAFFIQWVYDTGDKSASYHIPGRPPFANLSVTPATLGGVSDLTATAGPNAILGDNTVWQVYNTAQTTAFPNTPLADGGLVIAEGYMGYWQSTESYPDNKPEVWNASAHPWSTVVSPPYSGTVNGITDYDICGKYIRHHKFPEDIMHPDVTLYENGGDHIRIMGVKFENIKAPRTNTGDLIPGIIGYEILRSTRNGNKSIIAKGIINNMHKYPIPGTNKTGLYPNYPYNDLTEDPFLSTKRTTTASTFNPNAIGGGVITNGSSSFNSHWPGGFIDPNAFSSQHYTFHSPETQFNNPYLATKELKIYGNPWGKILGKYDLSDKHPKEKLITDYVFLISAIGGVGIAVLNMNGERRVNKQLAHYNGFSHRDSFVEKATYDLDEDGSYDGSGSSSGTIASGPIAAPGGTGTAGPFGTTGTYNGSGSTTNNVTGETTNSGSYKATDAAGPDPDHLSAIKTQSNATGVGTGAPYAAFTSYNLLHNSIAAAAFALTPNAVPIISAIAGLLGPDNALTNKQGDSNKAVDSTEGAFASSTTTIEQSDGNQQRTPVELRIATNIPTFLNYFSDGTDSFIRLIKAILRFRDYAVRYHSHGFYNQFNAARPTQFRTTLDNQQYLNPEILDFDANSRINNLYRSRTVALKTTSGMGQPGVNDLSRYDAAKINTPWWPSNFAGPIRTIENLCSQYLDYSSVNDPGYPADSGQTCSSNYVGLKIKIDNQYGQLNNIVQIPTSNCYTSVTIDPTTKQITSGASTTTLFGGDIYINRYTEKNTFFYFYDWLYGQPDGAQLDYLQNQMIPYPKYWANFNQFQTSDFTTSFLATLTNPGLWGSNNIVTPRDYYALDGSSNVQSNFFTSLANIASNFRFDKRGWFYLFNSGVRDFFVESEINVAYRDYGEIAAERFYDPYNGTDSNTLFTTDIIKSGNFYKYDISLSTTKTFINYTSWASMQSPSYNPYDAETCFKYQPTRVIYSLPSQYEGLKDGWRVFLPNNYYDFDSLVTSIKPINKSGAMIFFDSASPVQFQGTDQLQTGLGTKLTIGDGGLFSQPMQQVINTENSYEYASCQNRLSVINTPAGLYWMSQNQGKVFTMSGNGLKEVSNSSMKWWFNQFLPYRITEYFENFELLDNPVVGVGCQSMYDNENGLLYFSKRDFKLKDTFTKDQFTYQGGYKFTYNPTGLTVDLGDPLFFEDASWTISYDPKIDNWISYHDWHPTLNMPGKNTFMTVSPKDLKSIWIHNERCDLYCNYYGDNFPFEVEFRVNTGQTVNSLRSIEYILECYKYAPNCYDRFHVLDYNFDEAVIYNTEQVSGLLKLNLNPKQNPTAILQYPIINLASINILFSKEENKYRFNQFWDITADRGEYFNPTIPGFAQRPIWNTEANGYIRALNPANLNYNKAELQRKKFRHYTTVVLFRKLISNDRKMLVMITNTKELYSPR